MAIHNYYYLYYFINTTRYTAFKHFIQAVMPTLYWKNEMELLTTKFLSYHSSAAGQYRQVTSYTSGGQDGAEPHWDAERALTNLMGTSNVI